MTEMKPREWEDIAFRLLALCGGFEKYDILEDMGFSARNRRKLSQGNETRPNIDNLLRRQSTESTDSQDEGRILSPTSSEPELRRRSSSISSEGCKRTLSDKTSKVIHPPNPNPMDLDLSTFDFTELRSNSLSSTEI